jgi:DNA-binding IclR family transcriptional regulator
MKTVRTAAQLLRQFTVAAPEHGVTELARLMDLDKTSTYRLLRSLCDAQLVEQDPVSKRYRLGFGVLDLAAVRLAQFGVIEAAREAMHRLREATGETVAVMARDGHEIVCLQALEPRGGMHVSFVVGERAPVHCTASGLLWLSEMTAAERDALIARSLAAHPGQPAAAAALLAQIRDEGCAAAITTNADDVSAAAAPIRDRDGAIAHSLVVSCPRPRIDADGLWQRARQVKAEAAAITKAMGGRAV